GPAGARGEAVYDLREAGHRHPRHLPHVLRPLPVPRPGRQGDVGGAGAARASPAREVPIEAPGREEGGGEMNNAEGGIEAWEDVERHRRAYADASICCWCGRTLSADSPVWLVPCRLVWAWYEGFQIFQDAAAAGCRDCWHKANRSGEEPCALPCGGCGR